MDFNDTADEAAFRAEVRAFLDANAVKKSETASAPRHRGHPDELKRAKEWQARKADAGFACITWPEKWGGRGGTMLQQVIYDEEEARYMVPGGYFLIGLGMCIPTLMAYADEAALRRYVLPAMRGEEIWCQLFSEPVAGSDLAGLKTRAVRDGDDWVINGQKVWTSGAHYADFGIVVTRTDPAAPKHKGLTFFYLDMKSPGVEVRQIKQISGSSNFNEVFFTDVRIPDRQRLGQAGEGWKVSLTTLMNERMAVGEAPRPDFEDIFELARTLELEDGPAIADSAVRRQLALWYVQTQGLKYTKFRAMTAMSRGQTPGPEASIGKVVSAAKRQDIASFGMDLMGQAGTITDPALAPMQGLFQEALLDAPGLRIAGGTDEVLRNIIAERVLGLPGDIRVDKDVPYNKIPSGRD